MANEGNAPERRHSVAEDVELIKDPVLRAEAEGRNGLRQADRGIALVQEALGRGVPYRLRVSHVLDLHRVALEGLSPYAGVLRPASVGIEGSAHAPPGGHLVPGLMEEMCDHVNDRWQEASAVHLAAYVMWRMNWIHPFTDGNGRTSRAASYVVLSLRLGYVLPGTKTIPEQIAEDRSPYFEALEAADAAQRDGRIDVSLMEALLERLLAIQLVGVHQDATGRKHLS